LRAAFCPSSLDDRLAGAGFHPHQKSMGAGALGGAGLKRPFTHNPISFLADNLFNRGREGPLAHSRFLAPLCSQMEYMQQRSSAHGRGNSQG